MRAPGLLVLLILVATSLLAPDEGVGEVIEGIAYAPDSVAIAYDVRGQGDPALVFVHCWSCDRTFWHNQVDVFAADHRVVTLDLPGHGESGTNRKSWSITGLAADLQVVIEQLGLEEVILIGHSMGGPISVEAARRMPDRVVGIICVDTLHDLEKRFTAEMMEPFLRQFEADFEGTMRGFFTSMLAAGADSSVTEWIVAKAVAADQEIAIALMRDFPNLDLKRSVSELSIPIRCINAAPRPPAGPPTEIETNRKYGDFDATLIEGVGHFLQLERPEEFNARLRDTLEELVSP
jgi:pimeloyl-ACP methyl ester carboxylesterase